MSKRLTPNSDGSEDAEDSRSGMDGMEDCIATKKRRLVEFEPLRMVSITSTRDFELPMLQQQAYKLSEQIRFKNRQLRDKDREIERLRQRQTTDENTSCTINRYWNNLEEQLRLVLRGLDVDVAVDDDDNRNGEGGDQNGDFLEKIVQMDDDESKRVYDKRIGTSVQFLQTVTSHVQRGSEQYRSFSKKLISFMEGSSTVARDDSMNELVMTNDRISGENVRIQKENIRLLSQLSDARLRLREQEDRNVNIETRNEELVRDIDEARFDLEKANKDINKLDYRLYIIQKEGITIKPPPKQNGITNGENASCSSKEVEDLRGELEVQSELANTRLVEIREMNERVAKYAQDLERMKLDASSLTTKQILESREYVDLSSFFSVAIDECRRLRDELDTVTGERDIVRQSHVETVEAMKKEEEMALKKVLSGSEQVNKDNLVLKAEFDRLRIDYDHSLNMAQQDSRKTDCQALIHSLKSQITQQKSENARLKKKWSDAVNMHGKAQREVDSWRKRANHSIIIEIGEEVEESELDESPEGEKSIEYLKDKVKELRLKLEKVLPGLTEEQRKLADVLTKEKRLRMENARLTREIRRMGNMDRRERERHWEEEAQTLISQKDSDILKLKEEVKRLTVSEEALNGELEITGQAMEDLQRDNTNLSKQKQNLEDEKMKMMGDRISTQQMQVKLKEEKMQLEHQVIAVTKQLQASACGSQLIEHSLKLAQDDIALKIRESSKLQRALEEKRKVVLEQGRRISELEVVNVKIDAQLRSANEAVISKAGQHEHSMSKIRRLEEDVSVLKRKVERLRRSEKLGSTDAVLMEEIRELKEVLTCPSCKVNRKDAILTKCYHVFCMKCLKNRYDTRQRKCPKCNAGFGANDFQRAYIA